MCGATRGTPLLPTSFQKKFSVAKGRTCLLALGSSLFVNCGEKAGSIEKELATLIADLRSFLRKRRGGSGEPR